MYATKEDLLKKIYQLNWLKKEVTLSGLASLMNLTAPGVTYLAQDLAASGYLVGESKKNLILTPKGYEKALNLMWKYGLWKVFLIKKLKYSWVQGIREAEQLEHVTSDELARQLDTFLESPIHCPLGVPLYREMLENKGKLISLWELKAQQAARVRFIAEEFDLVNYLELNSLRPEKPIQMVGSIGYGGPYLIRNENREIILSEKATKQMYVEVSF